MSDFTKYLSKNEPNIFYENIERDTFIKIYNIHLDELILYDLMEKRTFLESFVLWKYLNDFYILHVDTATLITFYKVIGRAQTCNRNLDIVGYNLFFKELSEEVRQYKTENFYNKSTTNEYYDFLKLKELLKGGYVKILKGDNID